MWAKHKHERSGFTIVELLIVIVVIAILAAVTVVSYNGIQTRANNASRLSEFNQWRKIFELYKVDKGSYPPPPVPVSEPLNGPANGYCLGTGFPDAKCRDYLANNGNTLTEASSTALMDRIKTVSGIPNARHTAVNGTVGPYVYYGYDYLQMTVVLNGKAEDCPADLSYTYADDKGLLLCHVVLKL